MSTIPRSTERGLIEAEIPSVEKAAVVYIPRSTERGLIEALDSIGQAFGKGPFRVQQSAASLKPENPTRLLPVPARIPRSTERGLIEASDIQAR